MQLGAEGVFVGSGIFKSEDPARMANAIVQATTHFDDPKIIAEVSKGLGAPMRGHRDGGDPRGGAPRRPGLVAGTRRRRPGASTDDGSGSSPSRGRSPSTSRPCAPSASRASRCACRRDLEGLGGLILPGGESTTMRQLIDRWGLREPILDLAAARRADLRDVRRDDRPRRREIADGDEPVFAAPRRDRRRNAFGRQLDSFEAELSPSPSSATRPVHAVFIRAPVIERVGPDVDVLARLDDGRVVAVRERNILATAFHPELAGETRFHRLLATMAAEHADPGEGAGGGHHPTRARSRAR